MRFSERLEFENAFYAWTDVTPGKPLATPANVIAFLENHPEWLAKLEVIRKAARPKTE